jgi:tetratricopeptide (TPR) repeat protein
VKTIYNRGRAYEEMGIYQRSLEDFLKVIDIDENNDNAYLSVGKHYYREESYDKAGLYFDKALKINDQNSMAYYLQGRVNHIRGLFSEAVENYSKAINIDHDLGEAYLYRGAIKVKQKFRKSACSDFKMAKTLNVIEADEALRKYCK